MVVSSMFAVTACGDDDNDNPDPEPGTAEVRVVHASPDAPAVDIYAEGVTTPLVEDLAYGQATDYLSLAEGTYNLQIRPANAAPDSAPVFETGNLTIPGGATITALAAGLIGSTAADSSFRVLPLVEDFAAAGAGNAIVRIVHASADAPAVAIDVGNDGTPEIENLGRFAETGAAGVALPADTALQIGIWAGDPLARVTAFTTPALPEGAELFVIATGLVSELPREADGFSLLAIAPTGAVGIIKQNPSVFTLHASPNAPAVDVYAGTALLAGDLAFGELSATIQVPPGSYELDVYAAGTDLDGATPAASTSTPALAAGERYLAIASGFLGGNPGFQLIPVADQLALDPGNARVAVVHASPDAPAVDVSTVTDGVMDAPVLAPALAFGQAAGGDGIAVPPSEITVGLALPQSRDPVVSFGLTLAADLRAYAVAAGALSPEPDEASFRLLVVVTSQFPWAVLEVLPNS
jgi:hypothetical protein